MSIRCVNLQYRLEVWSFLTSTMTIAALAYCYYPKLFTIPLIIETVVGFLRFFILALVENKDDIICWTIFTFYLAVTICFFGGVFAICLVQSISYNLLCLFLAILDSLLVLLLFMY